PPRAISTACAGFSARSTDGCAGSTEKRDTHCRGRRALAAFWRVTTLNQTLPSSYQIERTGWSPPAPVNDGCQSPDGASGGWPGDTTLVGDFPGPSTSS